MCINNRLCVERLKVNALEIANRLLTEENKRLIEALEKTAVKVNAEFTV